MDIVRKKNKTFSGQKYIVTILRPIQQHNLDNITYFNYSEFNNNSVHPPFAGKKIHRHTYIFFIGILELLFFQNSFNFVNYKLQLKIL
jgi:hypothetical protein